MYDRQKKKGGGRKLSLCVILLWVFCDSLMVEGDLDRLEPRGTTKSHSATELTWEVYWGEVQSQPLRGSRRRGVVRKA